MVRKQLRRYHRKMIHTLQHLYNQWYFLSFTISIILREEYYSTEYMWKNDFIQMCQCICSTIVRYDTWLLTHYILTYIQYVFFLYRRGGVCCMEMPDPILPFSLHLFLLPLSSFNVILYLVALSQSFWLLFCDWNSLLLLVDDLCASSYFIQYFDWVIYHWVPTSIFIYTLLCLPPQSWILNPPWCEIIVTLILSMDLLPMSP